MSGLLKFLGKKQMEQGSQWFKSATAFGAATAIVGLYFTDWRVIVEQIPFYKTKFHKDE